MPDWNQLFADRRNVLDEPDPRAGELARAIRPGSRVLDLGCGGGRNLVPLAGSELVVVGLDVAPRGLRISRTRLAERGLTAGLVLADFRRPLPFADGVFAAVLSVKVLNHAEPEAISRAFAEVARVLRPGGRFVGTVISSLDARYGDGRRIGEHTFVHDRPPETGVPHHYFTEANLRRHLAAFPYMDLTLVERVVTADDPIFGRYAFREGVAPVLRHWNFQALR